MVFFNKLSFNNLNLKNLLRDYICLFLEKWVYFVLFKNTIPRIAAFGKLMFILLVYFCVFRCLVWFLLLVPILAVDFLGKNTHHFLIYNHLKLLWSLGCFKEKSGMFLCSVILCYSHWAILRFSLFLVLFSCSQYFKSTIRSLLNWKPIFYISRVILTIFFFLHCLHVPPFLLCKSWLSWSLNFFILHISLSPP